MLLKTGFKELFQAENHYTANLVIVPPFPKRLYSIMIHLKTQALYKRICYIMIFVFVRFFSTIEMCFCFIFSKLKMIQVYGHVLQYQLHG